MAHHKPGNGNNESQDALRHKDNKTEHPDRKEGKHQDNKHSPDQKKHR